MENTLTVIAVAASAGGDDGRRLVESELDSYIRSFGTDKRAAIETLINLKSSAINVIPFGREGAWVNALLEARIAELAEAQPS